MNDSNRKKALEHISGLFECAESSFREHPELSRRYIVLARKTATRHKVRFARDQKMAFCKQCSAYLKNGVNSTIRVHGGRIILTCKDCGFVRRFVYR